ncbi:hypothetical protein Q8F55_000818 [Vanrija albida]|uniref:BZIP domain-containing protein n=1 Tax=Vanrija albida TaxID=181172 RepID=A0ABR3QED8_9TREE
MPPRVQARPAAPKPPAPLSAKPASSSSSAATSPTASMPPPARPRSGSVASATSSRAGPSTAPKLAVPPQGKDLSSSTGRVFAKPSKEWVLPERAKPGRKASTEEPDNKRQSQNRLSQRAHRARRTDYIQTLEDRLRQYEADEIHSNVRLQEVARALKADNDKMKSELTQLRSALAAARADREKWLAERKALNDSLRTMRTQVDAMRSASNISSPAAHLDERLEYELAALARSPVLTPMLRAAGTPRRGSAARTPREAGPSSLACPICPDPDPDCPCQQSDDARMESTLAGPPSSPRCGLCDLAPEACLCNAVEEDIKPVIPRSRESSPGPDDSPDCGLCTATDFCACRAGAAAAASSGPASGISAAPPPPPPKTKPLPTLSAGVAAPAIPLRLRTRPAKRQSVWSLENVPSGTSRKEAVCTGDPSNCDACKNDSFGREFCGHLFGKEHDCATQCGPGKAAAASASSSSSSTVSIASLVTGPVPGSPATPLTPPPQAPLVLACCGAPELCGHAGGCAGDVIGLGAPETFEQGGVEVEMRPDEAWKALKAHPNSKFTPLAILADVVARRAPCLGPRVEMSPPPSSPQTNHQHEAAKRRVAVETSAVRDALRYLDGATPQPGEVDLGRSAKRRRV